MSLGFPKPHRLQKPPSSLASLLTMRVSLLRPPAKLRDIAAGERKTGLAVEYKVSRQTLYTALVR
jgi:hypothetical protein